MSEMQKESGLSNITNILKGIGSVIQAGNARSLVGQQTVAGMLRRLPNALKLTAQQMQDIGKMSRTFRAALHGDPEGKEDEDDVAVNKRMSAEQKEEDDRRAAERRELKSLERTETGGLPVGQLFHTTLDSQRNIINPAPPGENRFTDPTPRQTPVPGPPAAVPLVGAPAAPAAPAAEEDEDEDKDEDEPAETDEPAQLRRSPRLEEIREQKARSVQAAQQESMQAIINHIGIRDLEEAHFTGDDKELTLLLTTWMDRLGGESGKFKLFMHYKSKAPLDWNEVRVQIDHGMILRLTNRTLYERGTLPTDAHPARSQSAKPVEPPRETVPKSKSKALKGRSASARPQLSPKVPKFLGLKARSRVLRPKKPTF